MTNLTISSTTKKVLLTGVFLCVFGALAFADIDPNTVLTNVTAKGKNLANALISLLSWVLLAVGAILITVQAIKFARKDPQASEAFMSLGIGLVAGFLLLQVVKALMGNV